MILKNEAERLAHPQVGLIPKAVWDGFFDDNRSLRDFPNELIALMQAPADALLTLLPDNLSAFLDKFQFYIFFTVGSQVDHERARKLIWLAIVFSHPQLSIETLQALSNKLQLSEALTLELASAWGNPAYCQFLKTQHQQKGSWHQAIKADGFNVVINLARYGHQEILLELLNELKTNNPDLLTRSNMLGAIFSVAAKAGQIEIVKYLMKELHSAIKKINENGPYNDLLRLAFTPHSERAKQIQANDKIRYHGMLHQCNQTPFFSILEEFKSNSYRSLLESIVRFNCPNVLETLQYLQEQAKSMYLEAFGDVQGYRLLSYEIASDRLHGAFAVFKEAIKKNRLDIFQYLIAELEEIATHTPERLKKEYSDGVMQVIAQPITAVIKKILEYDSNDYTTLRFAIECANLVFIQYLLEKMKSTAEALGENGIQAQNKMLRGSMAWQCAMDNSIIDPAVINYLLTFPTVFDQAEQHIQECGTHIQPFVADQLANLQQQKQRFETANPNTTFDIADPEKARLVFYILRHLIREKRSNRDGILTTLIQIPSIKTMITRDADLEQGTNELLRIALSSRHADAASLLRAIPEVAQFETTHQGNERHLRELAIRNIAGQNESAIALKRALGPECYVRFEELRNQYQISETEESVKATLNDFYETLKKRYEQEPAVFQLDNGESKVLPLTWPLFQAMTLSDAERKRALQSYYEHATHGTFRYLSIPNPWIDPRAPFIKSNPNDPTQGWADLSQHDRLYIAVLYRYATDDTVVPKKEYEAPGSRLSCLETELADANRAHNLDEERVKQDAEGNILVDKNGNPLKEDDGEPDRPVCISGAGGHSLQAFFTPQQSTQEEEIVVLSHFIQAEIERAIRLHFKTMLDQQPSVRIILRKYANEGKSSLNEEEVEALKILDITENIQITLKENFLKENDSFLRKYQDKHQVTHENIVKDFEESLKKILSLDATVHELAEEPHIMRHKLAALMPNIVQNEPAGETRTTTQQEPEAMMPGVTKAEQMRIWLSQPEHQLDKNNWEKIHGDLLKLVSVYQRHLKQHRQENASKGQFLKTLHEALTAPITQNENNNISPKEYYRQQIAQFMVTLEEQGEDMKALTVHRRRSMLSDIDNRLDQILAKMGVPARYRLTAVRGTQFFEEVNKEVRTHHLASKKQSP
jgi:hypothetical protein